MNLEALYAVTDDDFFKINSKSCLIFNFKKMIQFNFDNKKMYKLMYDNEKFMWAYSKSETAYHNDYPHEYSYTELDQDKILNLYKKYKGSK